MKSGFMFIASTGFDPEKGKHVKDPYLGNVPTFGACMPNIRKQAQPGDSIFVISGKMPNIPQYIMGGLEVKEKINVKEAYRRFPEHHLFRREDRQLTGNIIVDSQGDQHFLDNHKNFDSRIENYIVGKNPILLDQPEEINACREGTLDLLKELFNKTGDMPINIIGRWRKLDEKQVERLRNWLLSLKSADKKLVRKVRAGKNSSRLKRIGIQPILF